MRRYGSNQYSYRFKVWDRNMKNYDNMLEEKKSTECIYLPGYQYREAKGHLKLSSCLHDAVINSDPRIEKYINKHEFYRQLTPRIMKDSNMNKIESFSFVINYIVVTPVLSI